MTAVASTSALSPIPLLEVALTLAIQLLIARHPDLLLPDDVPRIRAPPSLRSARAIVALGDALLGELARYDALDPPAGARHVRAVIPGDDFPF
jgi:hypothetical protein